MSRTSRAVLGSAFLCLVAFLLPSTANQALASNGHVTVDYTVKVASIAPPIFHVTCDVKGLKEPTVDLSLPTYTPDLPVVENFGRNVLRFKITDGAGNRVYSYLVDKQTWRAETEGRDRIVAEFDFLANSLGANRAKITPEFALFAGYNLFLSVEGHRTSAATVHFQIPPSWQIATALTSTSDPMTFTAPDYENAVESPTILGKPGFFEVTKFEVLGKPHYLVLTPASATNADKTKQYVETLTKIVAAEGAIFKGLPYDKYTFFYMLMESDEHPVLEYMNSHVAFFHANEGPKSHGLIMTASHAFFHTWNFRRIRPADEFARDFTHEPASALYWVVEGFSNYFGNQARIRSGLHTRQQFMDYVQDAVLTWELNEARTYTSPNDASLSSWYRFASPGGAFPISVHQQGNVLATLLDLSIRHDTQGAATLDDVMRALYNDFYLKGKGYSTDDLIGVINRISKHDYKDFFRRYVRGVEVPPYNEILGYAGYKYERVPIKVPNLGVRLTGSSEGPRVAGLTGEAIESELKEGDVVISIDELNVERAGHGFPGLRDWLTPKMGQLVDVVIKRDGVQKTVKTKVGSRDDFTFKIVENAQLTPEQQKLRDAWIPNKSQAATTAQKQ